MTQEGSPDAIKPEARPPDSNVMILSVIAIALLLALVVVVFLVIQLPAGTGKVPVSALPSSPRAEPQVTSSPTPEGTMRSTVPTSEVTGQPVTPTPLLTPQLPVDFILTTGESTSCGLTCRHLYATITNNGYNTAHNVCISVTLHNSRNEIIFLNDKPVLTQCVGDIAGGTSRTEPITLNADCGMFMTRCIQETLTLGTTVNSDEKTVRFPDQLMKV